jgi:hypothetical protein
MTNRNYTKAMTKILRKDTSTHLFEMLHSSLPPLPLQCILLYSPHKSRSYSVRRNASAGKHVIILATETTSKWVMKGKGTTREPNTRQKGMRQVLLTPTSMRLLSVTSFYICIINYVQANMQDNINARSIFYP